MALIYKCDRCSAVFDSDASGKAKYVVYEQDAHINYSWYHSGNRFNLCPACIVSLETWCQYVPVNTVELRYVKPKKRWWKKCR